MGGEGRPPRLLLLNRWGVNGETGFQNMTCMTAWEHSHVMQFHTSDSPPTAIHARSGVHRGSPATTPRARTRSLWRACAAITGGHDLQGQHAHTECQLSTFLYSRSTCNAVHPFSLRESPNPTHYTGAAPWEPPIGVGAHARDTVFRRCLSGLCRAILPSSLV